ncbi:MULTISPECIES: type II secretion protein F [Corynebacterium]|mgnify:FL=1|uniref:type II secretion protein F n=1 Tax=Corynebacterium TaxID=1716 RepID=UPI0029352B17|nr:type II secretion protein F [Corynebacterium sp. CTNIH16]MDV2426750.1 type II secretion protein F [Corynebacterium sp. CTNIH16]
MLSYLILAAALLIPAPSSAGRLASAPRRAQTSSVVILGAVFCGSLVFYSVGRISIAIAAAIIAWCVSWYVKDLVAARAERRGREGLAAYLGVVTADLRAGATLAGALARGVESLPATTPCEVSAALESTATLAARGAPPHMALIDAQGGKALPELHRLGHLLELSTYHGIAVASLLDQAQSRLDASRRHQQSTSASLQGPQATATVLACLPIAGIAMGGAMGANSLGFLLGGGLGGILLVVGVALACGGFAWSRVIIRKAAA